MLVYTNNGSGIFGSNTMVNFSTDEKCVVIADVNGDGLNDLITANHTSSGSLTVLTQSGIARPVLKITRPALNSLLVSWVSSYTNFILQTNNNLASTNWVQVALSGTNQSISLTPPPPGKLFFRLHD